MVPAMFVQLAAMPLNSNGKVDYRALPAPVWTLTHKEAGAALMAPRTPTEARLTAIFAEVLLRETVGVHDSFFEHGGNSLLAVQILTRTRAAFRVDLSLRELFAKPTVAELGVTIDALLAKEDELLRARIALLSEEEAWSLLNSLDAGHS
jgi:acyl carrier protein